MTTLKNAELHRHCVKPRFSPLAMSSAVGEGVRRFVCINCGLHITVEPVPSLHHAEELAYEYEHQLSH